MYSTIEGKQGWVTVNKNNEVTGVTDKFEEAASLVTINSGLTPVLNRVPVGKYAVYETGLGSYEDIYKELDTIRINGGNIGYKGTLKGTVEVVASQSNQFKILEKNKQMYITITGNVWEETLEGKNDKTINHLLDNEDSRINGIEVKLIDKTTNKVVQTTKTAYDATTKKNGVYKFGKVEIEKLANYYVEFTYDGITYTNVTTPTQSDIKITDENTSKASETNEARAILNNTFTELTGEGQKLNYNNKEITLSYSKDNGKVISNNISDRNKGLDTANKIVNISKSGDFTINSITREKYLSNKFNELKAASPKKIVREVSNVNLGLYVREQPDLGLVKDIEKAQVSINGKTYLYKYGSRISEEAVKTVVGVVFERETPTRSGEKYMTPVYRADAAYTTEDKSKELQVAITYQVGLSNNSKSLYATVNSLKEIYSKELKFAKLYTLENDKENVISADIQETTNGDNKSYTFTNLNVKVDPQTTKYVYITFNLPKEQIYNVAEKQINTNKEFRNYAEIASYSIYSDQYNSLYAAFDYDSIPNSFDVNNEEKTIEDDTDKAPGLQIVDAGQRTLSGIVFEDSDKDENDQQRIGDGKYTDGENKIANVKARLLDSNGNEVKVYDSEKKEFVDQNSITNDNGEYTISGFIPGDYTVQYTWGEGTNSIVKNGNNTAVTVDSYKSTIWTEENRKEKDNSKWYLQNDPRYSDAQDDYARREKFDTNNTSLVQMVKASVTDISNDTNKATMISNTNTIEIGIEKQDYEEVLEGDTPIYKFDVSNIDLGLIERPRQSMEIEKSVDSFKVVTDQGQTVLEARMNEEGKWEAITGKVTGGPEYGYVRGEIDTDLINSGTTATVGYKIKLVNTSDKDYASKDYYLYGITDESKAIALKATGIYDYLKGLNAEVSSNNNWEVLDKTSPEAKVDTITQVVAEKMVSNKAMNGWFKYDTETGETLYVEEVSGDKTTERVIEFVVEEQQSETKEFKNLIRDNSVIAKFTENGKSEIELKAGESKEIKYYGETALSSGKDISFENSAEVVDVQKTVNSGRSINLQHSNFYDRAEWVTITPPTGEDRNYTPIIITSIAMLAILGTGVVIIIKSVLK